MNRPLNRIVPNAPAAAYKTYAIRSPLATHFRPATCAEVECQAYAKGWKTIVDERIDLGRRQAYYIRKESGRRFFEHRGEAGLTCFDFEAGQRCFRSGEHRVSLRRPENFVVLGGDWRGNPLGSPSVKHVKPEFWIEDFQDHQTRLRDARERG